MLNATLPWALDADPDYPGRAWPDKTGRPDGLSSINGLYVHVCAFRVEVDPETHLQMAWDDSFQEEVDALQTLGDGALCTVKLPGLEGDWVIAVWPHTQD